jgi:putative nucleotidyltransferase with HDIG domain
MNTEFTLIKSSHFFAYKNFPLYYQAINGDFVLYKPAGITLKEMRIREKLLPDKLYLQKKNKVDAVQEIQKVFNSQLKQSIQKNDLTNVRKMVHKVVKVTLEEPVSGSIEGIKETVGILVSEYTKDFNVIKSLLDLSARDYTTVFHSVNVMALALGYASYVNYDRGRRRILGLAALLHDVGKVRVDTDLLQAPRQLTNDEFKKVQQHTVKGYNILDKCKFSNNEIKMTALQHHEKLDGSGYPLHATHIAEFAQIVSVIDCYEALTNDDRLYRKSMAPLQALEVIQSEIVDTGKFSKKLFKDFAHLLVLFYS